MTIPYSAVRKLLEILEPYGDVVHSITAHCWGYEGADVTAYLARDFDTDSLREHFPDLMITYEVGGSSGSDVYVYEEWLSVLDGTKFKFCRMAGKGIEAVQKYADQIKAGEE